MGNAAPGILMYEFNSVLKKAVNLPKKEKDALDLSVLDPECAINKAKIDINHKNDKAMAYITMAFKLIWPQII